MKPITVYKLMLLDGIAVETAVWEEESGQNQVDYVVRGLRKRLLRITNDIPTPSAHRYGST